MERVVYLQWQCTAYYSAFWQFLLPPDQQNKTFVKTSALKVDKIYTNIICRIMIPQGHPPGVSLHRQCRILPDQVFCQIDTGSKYLAGLQAAGLQGH